VQVTAVAKEPGGLDEPDTYTFSYHYKGKQYTCQASPDHTIHVGETVEMYIDPAKPEELVFISDNLPISFLLFLFAIMMASLATPKFQFLKRHLLAVIFVMEAILILTAALLSYTGLLIAGILSVIVTLFARRFIQKNKTMHAADSQSLAEEMQKP
ncbi:MAG: hypothetical protein J6C58_06015, partial [Bacteroidaceae bacterium]|nr:hypothetical protein [Bacteroidaceae bacterium]